MIRQSRSAVLLAPLDGAVALVVFCLALLHTRGVSIGSYLLHTKLDLLDAAFGIAFILLWVQCFSLLKLHDVFATVPSRFAAALKGVCLMMVPLLAVVYVRHPGVLTMRAVVLAMCVLGAYGVLRILCDVYLLHVLAARDPRRAIIIGSGRRAGKAWRELRTRYHGSIRLLGFMDDRDVDEMAPDVARRFLGSMDELSDLLLREVVDLVLIAMPIQSCYPLMQRAVATAEAVGVEVVYLHDIYSSALNRQHDATQSIFSELAPRQHEYAVRLLVKRAVDLFGAVVCLVLLSPLMLLLALGVKLTSKGPVFFVQSRYGHRRRIFRIVKFRSMVADAESMIGSLEHVNEASGPIFKMKNDPRVTPFGRFLRRTSLDELPQLWNVLLGDMSLVGPRPMSVRDVLLFNEATLMRRFSVKPGMTGLWQVNGRSDVSFDEWMALDRRYIDRWSLVLDLRILLQTVRVVVKRSGAM